MHHLAKSIRATAVLAVVLFVVAAGGTSALQYAGRVEAFDTDVWNVWTAAGQARVVVDGDGDTDLDCYVYDLSGRLLGKDDDGTDYCIVSFWRSHSGNVKLHIVNLGDVFNRYELRVE